MRNKPLKATLDAMMRAALVEAEAAQVTRLQKRVKIEAQRAVRNAWENEIADMATAIVKEKLANDTLRRALSERIASFVTQETLRAAVLTMTTKRDFSREWSFEQAITSAVFEHVSAEAET